MSLNIVAIISAKQAPGATSAKACPRGRRFSEGYFDEISLRSSRQLLRDPRAMELHRTGQAGRKAKRVITIKVKHALPAITAREYARSGDVFNDPMLMRRRYAIVNGTDR